ncbi:MAG TPA: hypothetical protein VEX70_05745 [Pyrinomonadaceae bacterium]|nr:hypothetical protein [Pyrinomonadaceae bacterium]
MSFKEDRDDAAETRTSARRPAESRSAHEAGSPAPPHARVPQEIARAEKFSTRLFATRWIIVAGACLLIAATFLLMRRMDAAFVAGTLGIVAWFWNERNRLRPHGIEAEDEIWDEDEEFEDRDEK